jgi:glucuronate isomerase
MTVMTDDYILESEFAKKLWNDYASKQPIIDFHCHLNPAEIYEDKNFENITQLWINQDTYGDHYKWRLMRANGVPESSITGSDSDYDKFVAFAGVMDNALGNPIYEWSNLELKRFFGIEEEFNTQTAPAIWEKLNDLLQKPEFSPRGLIAGANVETVVTTDDPIDTLEYHQKLAAEERRFKVLPGWRPDVATNIHLATFTEYIGKLADVSGVAINSFEDVKNALRKRMDFFAENGCKLCDHGADNFYFLQTSEAELDAILSKRRSGAEVTEEERAKWFTGLMTFYAKEYAKRGWVMQIHANCARDVNKPYFDKIGPNTGFDTIAAGDIAKPIADFFDFLEQEAPDGAAVPRTILFSLNPKDWMPLITIMTSHLGNGVKQKFQLGAAWWFNDTFSGMLDQLTIFSEESLLGNFVGMLTDSRSFVSYTRHEYFRRILCEYLGRLHATGRISDNIEIAGRLVENVSYKNTKEWLNL